VTVSIHVAGNSKACQSAPARPTKFRDLNDSAVGSPGVALYSNAYVDRDRMAMERDSFNARGTSASRG